MNLIIWLTLTLRIWSSLWLYLLVFNLVNLIIWLYSHFENLVVNMIYSLVLAFEFNHMTYSRFENLIVIMIILICFNLMNLIIWLYSRFENMVVNMILLIGFNLVNLIIWLTLTFRIWSSLWLYSSIFNIVNLIIWLTLSLRIWLSLWLYSFELNLMWRFYSYRDFYHLLGFTRWTSMIGFLLEKISFI